MPSGNPDSAEEHSVLCLNVNKLAKTEDAGNKRGKFFDEFDRTVFDANRPTTGILRPG
jgi:hypothetical protein